jgi:hypothetical protein
MAKCEDTWQDKYRAPIRRFLPADTVILQNNVSCSYQFTYVISPRMYRVFVSTPSKVKNRHDKWTNYQIIFGSLPSTCEARTVECTEWQKSATTQSWYSLNDRRKRFMIDHNESDLHRPGIEIGSPINCSSSKF